MSARTKIEILADDQTVIVLALHDRHVSLWLESDADAGSESPAAHITPQRLREIGRMLINVACTVAERESENG